MRNVAMDDIEFAVLFDAVICEQQVRLNYRERFIVWFIDMAELLGIV